MLRVETFFRAALALPAVVPFLFLGTTSNAAASVLWLSLWFGGGPYLLFAAVVFYWLRRPRPRERILALLWLSPVVFSAVMALVWLAYSIFNLFWKPDLVFDAASLLPIIAFPLLLGYGYALITRVLLAALELLGYVQTPHQATSTD